MPNQTASADADGRSAASPAVNAQSSAPRDDFLVERFAQLLTAAQGGSGSAFETLYNQLSPRVFSFARSRRATDPEGLVNDVFLQVFRKIGSFRGGEAQFNAWVFTIARNRLIDEARRRDRRPVEILGHEGEPNRASIENVESTVVDADATQRLLEQLDVLTADQRDVVLMRIVGDLTVTAIADIMGKQPGAVKALQRRAFHTLARHLGPAVNG